MGFSWDLDGNIYGNIMGYMICHLLGGTVEVTFMAITMGVWSLKPHNGYITMINHGYKVYIPTFGGITMVILCICNLISG